MTQKNALHWFFVSNAKPEDFIFTIVCTFAFGTFASQRKCKKLCWDCIDVMLKFE